MPVWFVASVKEQPEIILTQWTIYEVSLGDKTTRHFVGWNGYDREGRVSSPIIKFDPKTLRGKTRSGRIYELQGHPGGNLDALHTWGSWKSMNNVISERVVTEEYMQNGNRLIENQG